MESSFNTGSSSEVIKKFVTTNDFDYRCLISQSYPQPGQVHSQESLPPTNTDCVLKKVKHDEACVTNSLSSFEINDQHRHQISCCVPNKSSVK